jgi:hypothetical protein
VALLKAGPLIGDDDIREPELGVDLFFEGFDRSVGSDIGDRDENGVSGQVVYYYQTVTEAPAPRVPFASLLFLGLGPFKGGPGDPERPRMIHREHAKGCFRKRSHRGGTGFKCRCLPWQKEHLCTKLRVSAFIPGQK